MTEHPTPGDPDPSLSGSKATFPGEAPLGQVIAQVKDEPQLFVLGVGALLVGLVALGGQSPNLPLVVGVYAGLAVLVILGHYASEIRRDRASGARTSSTAKPRSAADVRRARRFWKPFQDGALQVVIGKFSELEAWEHSGVIGLGDAIGMSELRAYFAEVGLEDFRVSYADRMSGSDLRTSLVLLGGPDANSVANDALQRLNLGLDLGDPAAHRVSFRDRVVGTDYVPKRATGSGQLQVDYGAIVRTMSPFDRTKHVLIVAGSFGYGTWAAIRYLTDRDFLDDPVVRTGRPFECVVATDVLRMEPQAVTRVVLRELSDDLADGSPA
jgi:hypothetical protein